MPPPGIETAIPASERPQTHILNRAATGIGKGLDLPLKNQLLRIPSIKTEIKKLTDNQ